jgi:hypothetical protein
MQYKRFLREEIAISALPSKIWTVLTRPDYTRQYLFDLESCSDWQKGSSLVWKIERNGAKEIALEGVVLESTPGLFLQYTTQNLFLPESESIPTTYELIPDEEGIKLKISQELSSINDEDFKGIAENWRMILRKIKWLAEFT